MRLVLSGFLLALFPIASFATPCSPAPAPGTVSTTDSTAAPIFTKILVEAAGCSKTVATLCPTVKSDLASLQPAVLDAASKNSECAVHGTPAGGGAGPLPAADVAWYKNRTAFWFALYSDMSKKGDDVDAGTYQISSSFQEQFLDAAPTVAAPPAPAPVAPAPAPAPAAVAAPAAPVVAPPAPAPAPAAAAGGTKTTPPPPPTLTSISPAGAYTVVVGVALQDKDKTYTPKKIFLCVSSSKPSSPAPDCTKAPSTAQALHGGDGTENSSDYVVPDGQGSFTAMIDKVVPAGSYIYAVEDAAATAAGAAPATVVVISDSAAAPSPFRPVAPLGAAVAGLDVSGASSTDPKPLFLATGIVDLPLSSRGDVSEAQHWLTGLIRIAGMAQPGSLNGQLGSASSLAGYLAPAVNANPESIVQSIEVSGGYGYQIKKTWKLPYSGLDVGDNAQYKLAPPSTLATLSIISSFGAITPLSASQANPVVYNFTQQIYDQFSGSTQFPAGCPGITYPQAAKSALHARDDSSSSTPACYVAFIPTDRTHFYRNYEGGLRLKFYADDLDHDLYRFPGVLDLTWGQNEYVTGGRLHALVMHLGGVLPVSKVDGLYLFGSMDTQLNGKQGSREQQQQLLLVPASGVNYTDPSVTPIWTTQPNRDRYRIGFGLDILHLIAAKTNKTATP